MRAKAIFSVFGRKLPSGKTVFYYQCYDSRDKRQWAKSTGKSKKTEAMAYCMKLFRDGVLIPEKKAPTFGEFSEGWWDVKTCRYLKWRELHEPLTAGSIDIHRANFTNHIKDYFAKYRLDEITADAVEGFLLYLSSDGKKLKPKTVNLVYATLTAMLKEAARLRLIKTNPCKEVKKLKEGTFDRKILSVEEARKLFPPDWSKVWDSEVIYKAHKLAACTGLRIGELLGLRGEYVHEDYIFITGQYCGKYGYRKHTKNKHNRNVPLIPMMKEELNDLLAANGDRFVFSEDGGETPVGECRVRRDLKRALEKIGISNEEREERNLTFHAWRHFFNTLLRMSNVADSKVQSVTGHLSMGMTEHYTHFDARQFTEIRDVQAELLAFKEPEGNGAKAGREENVEMAESEERAIA